MAKKKRFGKMFKKTAGFSPGFFLHAARVCKGVLRGLLAGKKGNFVGEVEGY